MKTKALIVEDDRVIATSMSEVLTLMGLEVVGVAASVSDALPLAENTRPDVAIFDVRLAGRRDGIERALILRERLGLPVVFVTRRIDAQSTARATEAEPVAYLTSGPLLDGREAPRRREWVRRGRGRAPAPPEMLSDFSG